MRILPKHMKTSSEILPLECECGQTILYRIVHPDIDATCPRCGAEENVEQLITNMLIGDGPGPVIDFESLEIQGD